MTASRLASWEAAEARERARLAAQAEDAGTSLMAQLMETSVLLELSRLTSLQVDLASYARSVIEVLTQFYAIDGCVLRVEAAGISPIRAASGSLPRADEDALVAEAAHATRAVTRRGWHAFPLRAEGRAAGVLVAGGDQVGWAGTAFRRVADQLSASLGLMLEAERLRRRAASARAARLAAGVAGFEDPALEHLVGSLAALPGAVGARLVLQPPQEPSPGSLVAGIVDDPEGPATDRRLTISEKTWIEVRVAWASVPGEADVSLLDEIVAALAVALMRSERGRHLQEELETDPLTGAGNRRRAATALSAAWSRAQRHGEQVAVVSFDLDDFKRVNDTLGHAAGDAVLCAFTGLLAREVRGYDTIARMGGEEFVVICPATDAVGAAALAERIRSSTPATCAPILGSGWRQTVSCGIAVLPDVADTPEAVLRAADEALYAAKRSGRNRVVMRAAGGGGPAGATVDGRAAVGALAGASRPSSGNGHGRLPTGMP